MASKAKAKAIQGIPINIKFKTHLNPFQNENISVDYFHDY